MAATAAYFPGVAGRPQIQNRDVQQHQSSNSRPPSDIARWDLPEVPSNFSRDRSMPLDYSQAPPPHRENGLYGHPSLDTSFGVHESDNISHSQANHSNAFDHEMESQSHRAYDSYSGAGGGRYRTNSSSSMPFGMNGDSVYSHNQYADSPTSFTGSSHSSPFDILDPTYTNGGKISPLAQNELHSLHHPSTYPSQRKDYPPVNGYHELDRRPANGYPSEFSDDYQTGHPMPSSHSSNLGRYPEGRYSQPSTQNMHAHNGTDAGMRSVAPQATHAGFPNYDSYMESASQNDPSLRPSLDETLLGLKLQPNPMGSSENLETFIRPYLAEYMGTQNRLAFGERSVLVSSSRVAQKSYGTEKRFLCPPPTAILIGNSWWNNVPVPRRSDELRLTPPKVVISISGEPVPPEGSIEWTGSSGKSFDVSDPPSGTTFIGRCVGKQLFISDVDEKKKKVEAIVKITAPATDDGPERVIGIFQSRPIKVISKPSKKRQSAKNLELCINHGSTISLFHRLRSQTVSTKYLCVSGSGSSFKGSDGAPLMGLDQRTRSSTPSFIARTASWDPFVMYIVDVNKPAGGIDAPPPPPPQPDYPSPPPNSIPFTNAQTPIYYNQTVVLQCLTSGVVSPVLIIRKVDHQTCVVGGGLQEGAKNIADQYCPPGEVCGDPVSQLHKIAFEVHDNNSRIMPEPGTPGVSGAFLSCLGEKVNTYRPVDPRQWNQPPESHSPGVSSSPIHPTGGVGDYFGHESAPASPTGDYMSLTNDGGRVRNTKKRSDSSASLMTKPPGKGRRRAGSVASSGSTARRGSTSDTSTSSGSLWQIDIGESSVWTIVGTDQVRYNFYVPPVLFDKQHAHPSGSFPIPSKPVTPFPAVVKYLPPDRSAEVPKSNCLSSRALAVLSKPSPPPHKLLTIYGENFSKTDPVSVFFGSEPSPYVEIRCTEVLGCLPPSTEVTKRRPVVIVRSDGVVFPSSTMYP